MRGHGVCSCLFWYNMIKTYVGLVASPNFSFCAGEEDVSSGSQNVHSIPYCIHLQRVYCDNDGVQRMFNLANMSLILQG